MIPVSKFVLPNDFTVFYQPYEGMDLLGVGVRVGSMYDPDGASGLSHCTEHYMAYKPEGLDARLVDLKEREHGCGPREDIDIHTVRYATFYGTDLLLRQRQSLELLDIFARMVRVRTVDPETLKMELSAAYNEYLHHGIDNTEDLVDCMIHRTMYERNPARKRIDCEEEDLKERITPEVVRNFAEHYYGSNNMFAFMAGQDRKQAKRLAMRYFGKLELREPVVRPTTDEIRPTLTGIKSDELERLVILSEPNGKQKVVKLWHVGLAFPTNPVGHPDDEAIEVLTEILEFRAEEILRDQNSEIGKGTYHPFVDIDRSFLHGLFYLWFETPSGDFAKFGEERFIQECERVKRGGFTEDELRAAIENAGKKRRWVSRRRMREKLEQPLKEELGVMVNKKRTEYLTAFETTTGRLTPIVIEAACNAPSSDDALQWVNEYRNRLNKVGWRKLREVANEYLTTPHAYVRAEIHPPPDEVLNRVLVALNAPREPNESKETPPEIAPLQPEKTE